MPVNDQGLFYDRYQLIPRVLIFVKHGDSILLIKGDSKKHIWANLYNGIGGHVEKGEDILTAAKREFFEETGLYLLNPWLCAVVTIDTGDQIGIGMHIFRGKASSGKPKASLEGTLEWISLRKINKFPLVEDLYFLIPNIMKLKESSPPLFLNYNYDEDEKIIIHSGDEVLSLD